MPQEYLHVESLPLCVEVKTEAVAGSRVADHHIVAGVVGCEFALRYHTVAVDILVHHVACLPAGAEDILGIVVGRSLTVVSELVGLLHLGEVLLHLLVGLGESFGAEAPDLSELLAGQYAVLEALFSLGYSSMVVVWS